MRVVRDCGYLPDASNDDPLCLKRSGTFEVQSFFCSCTDDLCNGAEAIGGALSSWLPMAMVTVGLLFNSLVMGGGGRQLAAAAAAANGQMMTVERS